MASEDKAAEEADWILDALGEMSPPREDWLVVQMVVALSSGCLSILEGFI